MLSDDDQVTMCLFESPPTPAVREAIEIVYGRHWERDCQEATLTIKYNAHPDGTLTIERAQIFIDGHRVYGDRKKIEAECAAWVEAELREQAKRQVDADW